MDGYIYGYQHFFYSLSHSLHTMHPPNSTQLKQNFADKRNDPNVAAASNLSPYFHFGQLSVQRVVLMIKQAKKHFDSSNSFIEEAVVRRELADNFCFYNPNYDSLEVGGIFSILCLRSTILRTTPLPPVATDLFISPLIFSFSPPFSKSYLTSCRNDAHGR